MNKVDRAVKVARRHTGKQKERLAELQDREADRLEGEGAGHDAAR